MRALLLRALTLTARLGVTMWYWLFTSTTYGTWLPGDARGSVTSVRDRRVGEPVKWSRSEHDRPGEPWEAPIEGLRRAAMLKLKGDPIWLDRPKATVLLRQFQQTCEHRRWRLLAGAVMANHFHLVIAMPDDPDPRKVLNDLKAYGSRALNNQFGRPPAGRWWTTNGSKRKLPDDRAIAAAINYVLYKQPNPLAVWAPPTDAT